MFTGNTNDIKDCFFVFASRCGAVNDGLFADELHMNFVKPDCLFHLKGSSGTPNDPFWVKQTVGFYMHFNCGEIIYLL